MQGSGKVWASMVAAMTAVAPALAQPTQTPASPAESSAVSAFAPVTVQGERLQDALPEGSRVIMREALDEHAITGWDELGKRGDPAINFSRQTQSVNVRGVDQDRVVVRVDGIRVPWLNDGARGEKGGLATIDFSSLSAIDLVRSGGATESGAITGFLDLRTLAPDDLIVPGQALGALAKTGYDGADTSWYADVALAGRLGSDATRWLLQVGQRRGHELKNMGTTGGYGPDREQANPASYTQRSAMLKLQHDITPSHQLSLSGETFNRESSMDNMRDQGPDTSYLLGQNSVDETRRRDRVVAGYDYRAGSAENIVQEGTVKLYWQQSRLSSDQYGVRSTDARARIIPGDPFRYGFPSGDYGRDNSIEETGYGLVSHWSGRVPAEAFDNVWSVGLDWYRSETRQASEGVDNCPAIRPGLPAPFGPRSCDLLHTNQSELPDVSGRVWSVWAENAMSWAQGRYTLTPGLRFDAYKYSPRATSAYNDNVNSAFGSLSDNSGQRVSPSLMFAWQAAEKARLYARYGYGYKAPTATQLYMNYGAPGTYLRVGNPDLQAETSRGWEIGAELGDETLGASVAFFDNRYNNFIDEEVPLSPSSPEWNPAWTGQYPMGVTAFANRSQVRIYGAELQVNAALDDNWYTWGALAWAHGRDQETGNYLNSVAPLRVALGLGYKRSEWGVETLLTAAQRRDKVEYSEPAPGVPQADFQAPGYGVLDITGWWKPAPVKGLRLQAGVFNVFDKTYWNALNVPRSGGRGSAPVASYTEPGRHVRVWLTYQY